MQDRFPAATPAQVNDTQEWVGRIGSLEVLNEVGGGKRFIN